MRRFGSAGDPVINQAVDIAVIDAGIAGAKATGVQANGAADGIQAAIATFSWL